MRGLDCVQSPLQLMKVQLHKFVNACDCAATFVGRAKIAFSPVMDGAARASYRSVVLCEF